MAAYRQGWGMLSTRGILPAWLRYRSLPRVLPRPRAIDLFPVFFPAPGRGNKAGSGIDVRRGLGGKVARGWC